MSIPVIIVQSITLLFLVTFIGISIFSVIKRLAKPAYVLAANLWAFNQSAFLVATLARKIFGLTEPSILVLNYWAVAIMLQAAFTLLSVLLVYIHRRVWWNT